MACAILIRLIGHQSRVPGSVVPTPKGRDGERPERCLDDIVYLSGRTLSKDRVVRWAQCGWVEGCETMVVISKTGCGKSYLAQALGNAACRRLIPVRYARLAWICDELNRARELGGRKLLRGAG